jgi:tetratricopeptide (TPR) repeat protein
LLAAGLVMYFSLDRSLRAILAVDFFAAQARWAQVLEAARGNPENVYVLNAVNRALYHTGSLLDKLPLNQSPAHLLLLDHDVRAHWNKADLYLDLGNVNMALHHLTEALAFYGERPSLLRKLALANLALGNIDTARVELHSLAHTPCHSAWAKDYLRRIDADPTLSQDAEVTRLRRLMPTEDELAPMPPERMLKSLLQAHGDNHMAQEYLLSYLLLNKDLKGLAEQMCRPAEPASTNRPARYDEALLLISKSAPRNADVVTPPPSPESRQRFQRFSELAKACGRKPISSNPQMVREFGDSYFFYYFSNP